MNETANELIRELSEEIGPRRPCSAAEQAAAIGVTERLRSAGAIASVERFRGYASFGYPYALISGAAVLASLTRRGSLVRSSLAVGATAALGLEGDLRRPVLSRLLSRRQSRNAVAVLDPSGEAERTVVLMSHLDTSRSGLMFDPRFVGHLGGWITAQSAAGVLQGLEPLIGRRRWGRSVVGVSRLVLLLGLALLIERELRGEDVPGANDNASGVAVAATLAIELATGPLQSTRVVFCATGCEEAGTLGSQAFLESRDTAGWLFLNFDNVGGHVPLKFLAREGVIAKWQADPQLVEMAERIAVANPGLMTREDDPAGLTYDTSPVLARGGRALTFSAQDGYIPDLHWPTDTIARIDPDAIDRALTAGRLMLAAIDRGEAD